MKRWYVILLGSLSAYLFLSYGGMKGYSQAEVKEDTGKEKVLATVNGTPIYQKDIFGIGGMSPMASTKNYSPDMLKMAIDQELLYQEAKKRGLDKEPEYQEQIKDVKRPEIEKMMLIQKLEEKSGFFSDADSITDEDINQYYEENYEKNKDKWQKIGLERAKVRIKNILMGQKAQEKREKLLEKLRAKADIKIMTQEASESD